MQVLKTSLMVNSERMRPPRQLLCSLRYYISRMFTRKQIHWRNPMSIYKTPLVAFPEDDPIRTAENTGVCAFNPMELNASITSVAIEESVCPMILTEMPLFTRPPLGVIRSAPIIENPRCTSTFAKTLARGSASGIIASILKTTFALETFANANNNFCWSFVLIERGWSAARCFWAAAKSFVASLYSVETCCIRFDSPIIVWSRFLSCLPESIDSRPKYNVPIREKTGTNQSANKCSPFRQHSFPLDCLNDSHACSWSLITRIKLTKQTIRKM